MFILFCVLYLSFCWFTFDVCVLICTSPDYLKTYTVVQKKRANFGGL